LKSRLRLSACGRQAASEAFNYFVQQPGEVSQQPPSQQLSPQHGEPG
jgi:hypothetical protein